ncbi:hypothetical protein CR513_57183, partial [Mucuna pruriens]
MKLNLFELYLNPLQESSLSISVHSPNDDHFYIFFFYIYLQITPSPTHLDAKSITIINCFLVTFYATVTNDNMTFLHECFSFVHVPLERLHEILSRIGEW